MKSKTREGNHEGENHNYEKRQRDGATVHLLPHQPAGLKKFTRYANRAVLQRTLCIVALGLTLRAK